MLYSVTLHFAVVSNEEESNGHTVTTLLKRGDKFGEEELVTGERRTATVMSQDNVELFVVHEDVSMGLICLGLLVYELVHIVKSTL